LREGGIARGLLVAGAVQPAEPAIFVGIGPQRFITLPKLSDIALPAPFFGDFADFLFELWAERELLLATVRVE